MNTEQKLREIAEEIKSINTKLILAKRWLIDDRKRVALTGFEACRLSEGASKALLTEAVRVVEWDIEQWERELKELEDPLLIAIKLRG